MSGEQRGDTDEPGGVHVVPAGVRNRYLLAIGVVADGSAGVCQAGGLLHRQRIDVAAQQDGGTVAVVECGHHAGLPDAGGHFVAEGPQSVGHDAGGAHLGERQLRVPVQIFVEHPQLG